MCDRKNKKSRGVTQTTQHKAKTNSTESNQQVNRKKRIIKQHLSPVLRLCQNQSESNNIFESAHSNAITSHLISNKEQQTKTPKIYKNGKDD